MANTEPIPHRNGTPVPDMAFFNKGEPQNATQMISVAVSQDPSQMIYAALVSVALTLVALDMIPDLDFLYRSIVILYRIMVKKKWAVNSAFMALYAFVPVWFSFSYALGAFSLWGGGLLLQWVFINFSSAAAYWVGHRLQKYRERFLLMLTEAGFLWLGWCGLNGSAHYAANAVSSMAVPNTNICASTSLLAWTCLDLIFLYCLDLITVLVCITPGAGVVQGWTAIVMGVLSGCIPWFTMVIVHKKPTPLQKIDEILAKLHIHAMTGLLGVTLRGLFAEPTLCNLFVAATNLYGAFYGDGM